MNQPNPMGGGALLRDYLDEVVSFESMFLRREDAMELSAQIDGDWDEVLEIGMLPPEPPIHPNLVFTRKDACDCMIQNRLNGGRAVVPITAASIIT